MSKYAGNTTVQLQRPQRSQFDLSHYRRSTIKQGELTPVLLTECVPSDTFRGSTEILVRMAPLLAPVYDNLTVYVHFFFVPNRILWNEWETFITGGRLGVGIDPETAPVPPFFAVSDYVDQGLDQKGLLGDHLGLPVFSDIQSGNPTIWNDIFLDTLPFLVYSRCWYDYYRDRNFTADDYMAWPVNGGDLSANVYPQYYQMRTRHYEKDYFTAALPFTQRGEEVLMPLAGTASVTYYSNSLLKRSSDGADSAAGAVTAVGVTGGGLQTGTSFQTSSQPLRVENIDEVLIDSSDVSINDFRTAYALQVWLERNAIAGSRYTESTQAHFGVKPQDSRLQIPEYIGGGRIPIKISEVLSTAWSSDGTDTIPLANMGGHGVTYGNTNRFNYFCTEHGFIMGILSIMNPPSYHQGLPKMWRRRSFLDYPWPTFAKLGEQQVDAAEIYANPTTLTEDTDGLLPLFGYQSRYADWKFIPNTNHGDFHDTLLFWTLTRDFEDVPELGELFNLFEDLTQNRIFAVPGTAEEPIDNFWIYCHNKVSVKRPLPYFGTPNTMGFV